MPAQQTAAPQLVASVDDGAKPNLTVPTLNLAAGLNYSSSSDDVASTSAVADPDHLELAAGASALQPPPRRRYGRPRYNDSSHNPDGSPKYTFVAGAGFTAPIGNTYHYLNTSYGFQVGGGRNFNKHFATLVQFDYDRFGFNGRTLGNQQALYNVFCTAVYQAQGLCAPITNLDGNTHIWSFSVNLLYNFVAGEKLGLYGVMGAGFFHKVANFTIPTAECADYYCDYQVSVNQNIDHYTSNAPGFNGGIGLTYKASRFSSERLFVEGRYNLTLNSQRTGLTVANFNTTFGQNYNGYNDYPANSNRTTWLSYKAGIRF